MAADRTAWMRTQVCLQSQSSFHRAGLFPPMAFSSGDLDEWQEAPGMGGIHILKLLQLGGLWGKGRGH